MYLKVLFLMKILKPTIFTDEENSYFDNSIFQTSKHTLLCCRIFF